MLTASAKRRQRHRLQNTKQIFWMAYLDYTWWEDVSQSTMKYVVIPVKEDPKPTRIIATQAQPDKSSNHFTHLEFWMLAQKMHCTGDRPTSYAIKFDKFNTYVVDKIHDSPGERPLLAITGDSRQMDATSSTIHAALPGQPIRLSTLLYFIEGTYDKPILIDNLKSEFGQRVCGKVDGDVFSNMLSALENKHHVVIKNGWILRDGG